MDKYATWEEFGEKLLEHSRNTMDRNEKCRYIVDYLTNKGDSFEILDDHRVMYYTRDGGCYEIYPLMPYGCHCGFVTDGVHATCDEIGEYLLDQAYEKEITMFDTKSYSHDIMNLIYTKSYKEFWHSIDKVIFNPPATIIKWRSGEKTVVKCGENETFDPEKGLVMAIAKYEMGNKGNYYNQINKILYDKSEYHMTEWLAEHDEAFENELVRDCFGFPSEKFSPAEKLAMALGEWKTDDEQKTKSNEGWDNVKWNTTVKKKDYGSKVKKVDDIKAEEAKTVKDIFYLLKELIDDYGCVRISDLKEIQGIKPLFSDCAWGWTNLVDMVIEENESDDEFKWVLKLPFAHRLED